jgi:hypothetical protein
MTQTIAKKISLYDQDLNLWLETAIAQLKIGDLKSLDIENLIEELEGLAGRDRREVVNRLKRLIEHILKRCHVDLPDCFRGWEVTIANQRDHLKQLLKQSPSLKQHFSLCFDEAFDSALNLVQIGYPDIDFPTTWQFSRNIEDVLKVNFWEEL